jgi:hypothetical protein
MWRGYALNSFKVKAKHHPVDKILTKSDTLKNLDTSCDHKFILAYFLKRTSSLEVYIGKMLGKAQHMSQRQRQYLEAMPGTARCTPSGPAVAKAASKSAAPVWTIVTAGASLRGLPP